MSEHNSIINDLQTSLQRSQEALHTTQQMYGELQAIITELSDQARQSELGRLYLLEKVKDIETERQRIYLVARELTKAAVNLSHAEPPAVGAWHRLYNAVEAFTTMRHNPDDPR